MLDPQFTVGNAVTIGLLVFGAGGAWVSIRAGLRDVKGRQVQDAAHVAREFTEVHREMSALRNEFVRKDVDRERDEKFTLQIQTLKEQWDRQSRRFDELEAAFRVGKAR